MTLIYILVTRKSQNIIKQLLTILLLDMKLISTIECQYWPRLSPRSRLVSSGGYLEIITQSFGYQLSINPRLLYQLENLSWRADNGWGLVLRAITKTQCYNMFITYSNSPSYMLDVQKKQVKQKTDVTPLVYIWCHFVNNSSCWEW